MNAIHCFPNIFRRRQPAPGGRFFEGFTDWHSHILPGVDDGVQTMEEALEVLEEYDRLGVAHVWLTPHVMEDIPNTTAALRARFAELREARQERIEAQEGARRGHVTLHLGAEYMLDNLFEERLAAGDLLPVGAGGQGDHLLVETSCVTPPMDLHGALERIRSRGFHPLLAHPERYIYMEHDDYAGLVSRGVKLQLNLGSSAGMYGVVAKRKAHRLLREGMYSFAGTDLHREGRLKNLKNYTTRLLD